MQLLWIFADRICKLWICKTFHLCTFTHVLFFPTWIKINAIEGVVITMTLPKTPTSYRSNPLNKLVRQISNALRYSCWIKLNSLKKYIQKQNLQCISRGYWCFLKFHCFYSVPELVVWSSGQPTRSKLKIGLVLCLVLTVKLVISC